MTLTVKQAVFLLCLMLLQIIAGLTFLVKWGDSEMQRMAQASVIAQLEADQAWAVDYIVQCKTDQL